MAPQSDHDSAVTQEVADIATYSSYYDTVAVFGIQARTTDEGKLSLFAERHLLDYLVKEGSLANQVIETCSRAKNYPHGFKTRPLLKQVIIACMIVKETGGRLVEALNWQNKYDGLLLSIS